MTVTQTEDGKVVLSSGAASIAIEEQNYILYVQDIQGLGDPKDMMKLIRKLISISETHPLYFPVKDEYHRLRSLLKKQGGSKQFEVWRLG